MYFAGENGMYLALPEAEAVAKKIQGCLATKRDYLARQNHWECRAFLVGAKPGALLEGGVKDHAGLKSLIDELPFATRFYECRYDDGACFLVNLASARERADQEPDFALRARWSREVERSERFPELVPATDDFVLNGFLLGFPARAVLTDFGRSTISIPWFLHWYPALVFWIKFREWLRRVMGHRVVVILDPDGNRIAAWSTFGPPTPEELEIRERARAAFARASEQR